MLTLYRCFGISHCTAAAGNLLVGLAQTLTRFTALPFQLAPFLGVPLVAIDRAAVAGWYRQLDAATPTRLFASLPPGTEVQRMGLADAVELTRSFLDPETT